MWGVITSYSIHYTKLYDILSLLEILKEQHVTIMVATHDLEQAAEHFDRVLLLRQHLIGFGTPDLVLQTEKLIQAYGGRVRKVAETGLLTVDDCCDDQ